MSVRTRTGFIRSIVRWRRGARVRVRGDERKKHPSESPLFPNERAAVFFLLVGIERFVSFGELDRKVYAFHFKLAVCPFRRAL